MLSRCQGVPQDVVLGADAHEAVDTVHVGSNVEALHVRSPRRGLREPHEHVDGGGLPGAVGPEHAEALAVLDAHRQRPHRRLGLISHMRRVDFVDLLDHDRVVMLGRPLEEGQDPLLLPPHVLKHRRPSFRLLVGRSHHRIASLPVEEEEWVSGYPMPAVQHLPGPHRNITLIIPTPSLCQRIPTIPMFTVSARVQLQECSGGHKKEQITRTHCPNLNLIAKL
mmetsp:Transcript_55864/g.116884  ORF Transcript_55864/g.116884 Transcript_55864/m.116884 type:complete len:223 (+) Transcript_55864:773-1441(+)